jgi:hypothetical protein
MDIIIYRGIFLALTIAVNSDETVGLSIDALALQPASNDAR